ncbi:MAG: hypothetical protein ACE14L_08005 [Terriglobales bacterium]
MPSISPLTTALLIVLAVGFTGAVVAFVRDRARFRGYQALTADAIRLARTVKGSVFRDGTDLVVSGSWRDFPVQVRFSNAENTPGLDMRMGAPAGFTLSVMPGRSPDVPGRVLVRTPDERFNARFAVRSDHPTLARMFLGTRAVMACLERLCRSPHTFVLISNGQIEIGELSLPDAASARTASENLEPLGQLAHALRSMPGADTIKIDPLRMPRPWMGRIALAVGIVVVIAVLVMAADRANRRGAPVVVHPQVPEGVWEADAERIPGINRWRLAKAEDFDPAALAWMRQNHVSPEARVEGRFCGAASGVAYLLMSPDQTRTRRLVVLCQGENVYDTTFPLIGMVMRIPHEQAASMKWAAPPPQPPDGDVLLLTRAPEMASALALFVREHRIVSGVPADYHSLKLD